MRIISIAAIAAVATAPVAAQAATPLDKETSVWQAFKDKKADTFKGLLTPDFVAVYAEGTFGRDHELQMLKVSNLKSFKISDFKHRMIDPEDVLMTYTVDVKGTQGKEDVSGVYRASSVWHRSGKLWRAVYHSEIKAK
ncbi:nuclear transport factor 2 family protein [Sphingomonas hankyongi]|uniref:Nuclear transport factor 2 family protein n=1 Tax=Sphingomonas hankyongi TaxID=2908209 RepID=A0ABT0S048_9SPHN|nr:nuclear transport factor 2 family protein [Sphingomonas hankyongi]MCL6729034.1 nuclear transport factor 2 family protein [Sphingomonas hankyongi]